MEKIKKPIKNSLKQYINGPLFLVNTILNWIEHLGARDDRYGRWYRDKFYYQLLKKELKSVALKPGAKILHIGCGPLPMTAFYLAEMGFHIGAIDYDLAAVQSANKKVSQSSHNKRITVWKADGKDVDCSPYDAVWISLAVSNKREIVTRALQTLKPGAPVLYRNYQGPLTLLYSRLDTNNLKLKCEHQRIAHTLGKETIIVWR